MRLWLRAAALAGALLVCSLCHYVSLALTRRSGWYARFLRMATLIVGLRVRCEGRPVERGVLYVANHTSWLDIILLGGLTGGRFISKAEVARWPVIGMLARMGETLFVERGERGAVRDQVEQVAEGLAGPRGVILFPEGTTGGEGRLLPFRAPLFAAVAGRRDLVVQPVAIDYGAALTEVRWPRDESAGRNARRLLVRRGAIPVTVRFLPPIDPAGLDRKAIAAAAERAVAVALT